MNKFDIIEDHISHDEKLINNIESYFINYLQSDTKILLPCYIQQYYWFHKNIIDINNIITDYLLKYRNNVRILIKQNKFNLDNFIIFINTFFNKLEYIESFNNSSEFIKNSINKFMSCIITDSYMIIYLESIILKYDDNIEKLINTIYKIEKYNLLSVYLDFILIIGRIIKKNLVIIELPIPNNLKYIYMLNDFISFYIKIKNYFNFLNDNITIILNLMNIEFINIFKKILDNNKYKELYFIINNYPVIYELFNNNKSDFTNMINNHIMNVDIHDIEYYLYFINNETIKLYIDSNSIHFINKNIEYDINNIINIIVNKIDFNIKNNILIDTSIINALLMLNNHDYIIKIYYELLIKRIITSYYNNTFNIRNETFILKLFQNKLDKKIYKINKVITDVKYSIDDNNNFNNISLIQDIKINIITTSYNNWDINQNEGFINDDIISLLNNTQLINILIKYSKLYKLRYNNKRKLNWFLHFGEINIIYLDKEIKLLPIQFMILELFENNDNLHINYILEKSFFNNYSNKFKNDIISSLILSKLLILNNNTIKLTQLNNFETDIINIFHINSDYMQIWENNRNEQFIHTREEIINTNINQILKTNKLNKIDLLILLKEKIKLFIIPEDLYEKCINYMIKYDYIKCNEEFVYSIY